MVLAGIMFHLRIVREWIKAPAKLAVRGTEAKNCLTDFSAGKMKDMLGRIILKALGKNF